MVAYQKWVSIVFDTARKKGASIDSLDESKEVLQVAADLWSDNKPYLKGTTVATARSFADDEIVVS